MALGLLASCDSRERPTFPTPSDGVGPSSIIDVPSKDTVVQAGPDVILSGSVGDADGVDTVYFEVAGSSELFQPFVGPKDTVRFGLPVSTNGLQGQKLTFLVFGTDRQGNRGDTAYRVLDVR